MRKKSIKRLFDYIFWYGIYLLPLIALLIFIAKNGDVTFTLADTFNSLGMGIVSDNYIYSGLVSLFGVGGTVPLFTDYSLLMYLTYFIFAWLLHLMVDVLLFLPRLCLNFADKMGGED